MRPHFFTKLELRPAAFGQGVFSLEPIAPGTEVLRFGGELFSRLQDLDDLHHFIQLGPSLFLGPSGELDDYVNHSCLPNCGLRLRGVELTLVAIEPIEAGQELTFDYATCLGSEDPSVMECGCGAPGCRGRIAAHSLSGDLLTRYRSLGVLPSFVDRSPAA